ncbi:EF-P 5-aminopentanol modification-associated protein YfmH [Ferviditalea candida]|uniref:Pitrilysin family protein n=1 Tax=Ferviditalea candida TaxID=3108399 RepID=A0ABU5ZLA0_9BACL|nr:pitrilysin family protein [Paenibacillaceae bacterium T2]
MEVIEYERLKEKLYYEQLPNGLKVFVLPKPGFQKTFATFTTRYGSIDNHFEIEGKGPMRVPDGIAHFLEHKMFEEPEGDVFAKFASQGASANAFTSFDRTSYLFSATDNIPENLQTLLNFVQNPYFTDENVEKEKGIIGQEINMYRDNADWRIYYGLIEALYSKHPIHIDIAGTLESISKITKEMLYDCYHAFYQPANMLLFVVGGVDPEEMISLVKDNQQNKPYAAWREISRFSEEEPLKVFEQKKRISLPVAMPKCLLGIKEKPEGKDGEELLIQESRMKLLFDMLFSQSSALYQKLYDEQLITDNFGFEYQCAPDYAFSIIGGDTPDPDLLVQRIREEIDSLKQKGLDQTDFERSRRKKIGGFLRMMNSPEAIAHEFAKYRFRHADLFRILPVYESLTFEEVNRQLAEHFDWTQMAVSVVAGESR